MNSLGLLMMLLTIMELVLSQNLLLNSGLSASDKLNLLNKHNEYRNLIASGGYVGQPSASNMKILVWDETIAESAQDWANNMIYGHSWGDYGENLHQKSGTGAYNSTLPVEQFFIEVNLPEWQISYIPSLNFNTKYAHYTQLVWALTSKIGCGYVYYRKNYMNYHYTVCQYDLPGNYENKPVYQIGTPCQSCTCDQTFTSLCAAT